MNKIIALLSLVFLLAVACDDVKKEKMSKDVISINLEKIETPDFKELFSSIEVYPLETNDSSLIGDYFNTKRAFYVPNRYYVVVDDNYVIHLFNMNGKSLSNSSKCIGQGPEEYYILQDVVYNNDNDTFDILDPFGNICIYDSNFNFISKTKISYQPKERFRKFFAIDKSQYILFDNSEKGSFIIYDLSKNEIIENVIYSGLIAELSSISSPINISNNIYYFTPPEINNQVYIYDNIKKELTPTYYFDGGNKTINEADLVKFNSVQERSEYILRDSPKYASIDRLYNDKYVISTYIKQQQIFINVYNIETKNNKTLKKTKDITPNLPSFFSIEDKAAFAVVFPNEINEFTDNDLITNKNILQTIKEDANPCIVKYNIKL